MTNRTAPAAATLPQYDSHRTEKQILDWFARTSQVSTLGSVRIERYSDDDGDKGVQVQLRGLDGLRVTHHRDNVYGPDSVTVETYVSRDESDVRTQVRTSLTIDQARRLRAELNAMDLGIDEG